VIKVVKFSRIDVDYYNLGLADFEGGKLIEDKLSNNFDVLNVLSTVAEVVRDFTLKNPERSVVILTQEERRLKLYHAVFRRKADELMSEFWIWGLTKDEGQELYDSEKSYKGFIVKRK